MSRSNSTLDGNIAHGGQDQPGLGFAEGLVGDQIHAAADAARRGVFSTILLDLPSPLRNDATRMRGMIERLHQV